MINKIISFPIEQIRRDDINLIFSIIENIKNENDYKKSINIALDYIYKFIISDVCKGKNFIHDFTRTVDTLKDNNDVYFSSYYIEKIIGELLKENNWREIEFFYDFLSYFILSFKEELKPQMRIKFVEYLNTNNNSKKMLDNIIKNIEKDTEDITLEKKIDHITAIMDSIKSILFFAGYDNFFTKESIMKLCNILVFTKKKPPKQNEFFRSINFLKRNNLIINFEDFCESFFNELNIYLSDINKDNYLNYLDIIDDEFAEMVLGFYQRVNNLEEDNDNNKEFISENSYIKENPLKFKYFEIVWKMFTKTNQFPLMEEFMSNFSLRLFSPEERHEIWEIIIKKIFDEQDNFVDPKIALNMIKNIVLDSEKFGTGGVISNSVEKIKKFPLKLSIKSKIENIQEFELNENIYTTSTLYELKKEIQKKINIDPILIDFYKFNNSDINSDSNGKNLCFIFNLQDVSTSSLTSLTKEQLEKKYTLTIKKSREYKKMKKFNLLDENNSNNFNKKTISTFKNIFKEATNNTEKMNMNLYKEFYKKSTGYTEQVINNAAGNDFTKYDHEKKNYWDFDNFLEFFLDAYKNNKVNLIFENLNNLGYRNDLELINSPIGKESPLYYEENNKYEYPGLSQDAVLHRCGSDTLSDAAAAHSSGELYGIRLSCSGHRGTAHSLVPLFGESAGEAFPLHCGLSRDSGYGCRGTVREMYCRRAYGREVCLLH